MTALPAPLAATLYEQLCNLPEHVHGEIINGQLHAQPRPSGRHGLAERALNVDLGGPFDFGRNGPGAGGSFQSRKYISFAIPRWPFPTSPAGDASECRRFPTTIASKAFRTGSARSSHRRARRDRIVKLPFYAAYGVAYAWLVDPEARTLEAFALRQGHWLLIASLQEDAPVRVEPFAAVEFSLSDLWA
jgi:Uma2 family endonuclease